MSYSQYLPADKVLAAQKLLSGQHDEMLFIVIHQASELWMKSNWPRRARRSAATTSEPSTQMLAQVYPHPAADPVLGRSAR